MLHKNVYHNNSYKFGWFWSYLNDCGWVYRCVSCCWCCLFYPFPFYFRLITSLIMHSVHLQIILQRVFAWSSPNDLKSIKCYHTHTHTPTHSNGMCCCSHYGIDWFSSNLPSWTFIWHTIHSVLFYRFTILPQSPSPALFWSSYFNINLRSFSVRLHAVRRWVNQKEE